MSRFLARTALLGAVVAITACAWTQDALTAKLDPSGMVNVSRGADQLAMIELNAHGLNWQHAPQESATAKAEDLPVGEGKRFVGALPIPNAGGGAIEYTQDVTLLPEGIRLEYDISMTQAMKLNGLQLSIFLAVDQYAGEELMVAQPNGEPKIVGLPLEQGEGSFQLWRGDGSKIAVAGETEKAVTIEMRAATDVVLQDLRQWERPVFEVRFPAIMQEGGLDVTAEDRFHLDLTITFAAPMSIEGP